MDLAFRQADLFGYRLGQLGDPLLMAGGVRIAILHDQADRVHDLADIALQAFIGFL